MLGYLPLSTAPISSIEETAITPIPPLILVLTPEQASPPTPPRNVLEHGLREIRSPGSQGVEATPIASLQQGI